MSMTRMLALHFKKNMPDWNVVKGDIHDIDFTPYHGKVDLLTGGFPCQAFSYAGKRLGFEETRGTLFFELARAVKEIQPKVFMAENVKGLLEHDNGRTIETIKSVIAELGYTLIEPRVLRAIQYNVPQKESDLFSLQFGMISLHMSASNGHRYAVNYAHFVTLFSW